MMLGSSLAPTKVISNSSKICMTNKTFKMMVSIKEKLHCRTTPMTPMTMADKAFKTTLNNTKTVSRMTKKEAKARKTKENLST